MLDGGSPGVAQTVMVEESRRSANKAPVESANAKNAKPIVACRHGPRDSSQPQTPPRAFTLHSFARHISFVFVATMLSTTRSAASMALRGWSSYSTSSLCAEANNMHSQTHDGTATIPCWKRSLPVIELLRQGRDNEITRHHSWEPGNAATDEGGTTRSAIAEPGGKEGRYAICAVRQPK
tara:strand:+ start:1605 stop:2144 length:540 start_codon:yes stop_codon:yes gene_type:complete